MMMAWPAMFVRSASAGMPVKIAVAALARPAIVPLCCCLTRCWAGDVADLVAEHRGEVRLVLEVGQDPARDVDVAAHGREGVHVVGVDDREVPLELRPLADRRELLADPLHVLLQLEVVVHAHLLREHEVHLLGGRDLLAVLLRLWLLFGAVNRPARDDGHRGARGEAGELGGPWTHGGLRHPAPRVPVPD
jgi:hypothetical protein